MHGLTPKLPRARNEPRTSKFGHRQQWDKDVRRIPLPEVVALPQTMHLLDWLGSIAGSVYHLSAMAADIRRGVGIMSSAISSKVWGLSGVGGTALLCLLALADWADDSGNCEPSIAAIAKKIRVTDRYAKRLVHRLIDAGYVRIIGNQYGGAPGSTRKYRLEFPSKTDGLQDTPRRGLKTTPKAAKAETGVLPGTKGWPIGAERSGLQATRPVIGPSTTINAPMAHRLGDFMCAHPRCRQKESKGACLKSRVWTEDLTKQNGQFVPAPHVYFRHPLIQPYQPTHKGHAMNTMTTETTIELSRTITMVHGTDSTQYTEIRLIEPTVDQLCQFVHKTETGTPIEAMKLLISIVSGVPLPVLGKVGVRDFYRAQAFLIGFIAPPEEGDPMGNARGSS